MEKRLIPEIRFKGFKGDWEEEQLSNIYEFSNGINAPKESYGKGRKMVSVLDILRDRNIIYDEIVSSVQLPKEQEETKKLEKGDMVFVRSSEVVEEVGWAKSYNEDKYALFSGFSIRGKKKSNNLSYFIELSLNNKNRKQIENKAGGSTRYNVSQKILREINLLLPELTEQEKIGMLFESLDQTIDLQGKVLEENKRLKQALLQKLFPKKGQKLPELRLKGFSGEWNEKRLGDIVDIGSSKRVHQKDWRSEGIPFYRARDLVAFAQKRIISEPLFIEESKFNEYSKITGKPKANDLLVTGVGTIGVPFLVKENKDFYFKDGNIVWIKNDVFNGDFLYYSFLSEKIQNYIFRIAGIGTVATYTIQGCKNTPITFPSLPEQEAIGNLFKALDKKIEREEERLQGYKTLKKSLLQKMFV